MNVPTDNEVNYSLAVDAIRQKAYLLYESRTNLARAYDNYANEIDKSAQHIFKEADPSTEFPWCLGQEHNLEAIEILGAEMLASLNIDECIEIEKNATKEYILAVLQIKKLKKIKE